MKNSHILNKVSTSEIKEISITGKRWFQQSYGNTYHSVDVSVLVAASVANRLGANPYGIIHGDVWIGLAYESDVYGYERHFEHTALQLLILAVNDAPAEWKKLPYICQAAEALDVPYTENVYDVKRKKDL